MKNLDTQATGGGTKLRTHGKCSTFSAQTQLVEGQFWVAFFESGVGKNSRCFNFAVEPFEWLDLAGSQGQNVRVFTCANACITRVIPTNPATGKYRVDPL